MLKSIRTLATYSCDRTDLRLSSINGTSRWDNDAMR